MSSNFYAAGLAEVAEKVGAFCLDKFRRLSTIRAETKGTADYVSDVDRGAEVLTIRELGLRFPDIPVVGEEGGGIPADLYWIVDPLDGTANFLSGLPIWAVSIALIENGEPTLGAIALPALGILVVGGVGLPLSVSGDTGVIKGAAIAYGVGRNPHWKREDRQTIEAQLEERGHHVVCLGSCASSLAFVALGRIAGYFENGVALWDCAAGVALCRAAGCEVAIYPSVVGGKVDVRAECSVDGFRHRRPMIAKP